MFLYIITCACLLALIYKHDGPNQFVQSANLPINNRSLSDWTVVDLAGSKTYKPMYIKNQSIVPHDDISHWPDNTYYWQAPQAYYQWKIYTYAGDLKFIVNHIVTRGDTSGKYLDEPDLVLEGGSLDNHMKLGFRLREEQDIIKGYDMNRTIMMPLSEPGWFHLVEQEDPETRKKSLKLTDIPVSRANFSLVLAGLDRSLIRAKYHMDQVEGKLLDVNMRLENNRSRTSECDDDCSGVLLDELDEIGLLMDEIRRLAPGLKDGPWRRLAWLSGRANNLTEAVNAYSKLIALGKSVIEDHSLNLDFETLAGFLELKANNLDSRAPIIALEAYQTRLLAEKTLNDLKKILWGNINDVIKSLNEHGFGNGTLSPSRIDQIVRESEMILTELRNRSFKIPLEDAEKELRKAKLLLDRVRALLIDPDKSAELLKRLERLHKILNDFVRIIQDQVISPMKAANELVSEGKKKYQLLLALLRDSEERARESQANLDEAKRLLELTRKCLSDEALYLDQLPRQLIELNNSIHDIEVKRSILTQVNPDYQSKYVDRCRDHKDLLVKKARELDGLFNATRDVADYAIRAANVYKNIILAIEEAEKAAKRAYDAAEKAYKVAVPDMDQSLADKARESKRKSMELLEKAKKLRDYEVQKLSLELAKRRQLIDQLMEMVKNLIKDLDQINAGLKQLADKNLFEQIGELDLILQRILERLADIFRRLEYLSDLIYNKILPQYEQLSAGSDSSLGNLTQVLENARKDLADAIKYAASSKISLEKLLKLEAKLDVDLDLLRRKIQLAHQEASSVHVSMMPSSDSGICTRSYFIPSILSAQEGGLSIAGFNLRKLSLTWSLHNEESESLLLFIGSKNGDEYLAIEMYDRHIRVVHNLRAYSPTGSHLLTHPRLIELNDKGLLADETWYQITLSMGNDDQLKLNVSSFGNKKDRTGETVSQRLSLNSQGLSRLQTSPYGEADLNFYVGGLPQAPEFTAPSEIKSSRLTGCLYDLTLNHQQLGLWNFKSNQGCEGCMEGPQEIRDTATFSFTGSNSYASLSQIGQYDRTFYSVSLSVKTSDTDSLLFLSFSETSNHYLSIFLRKGRVGLLIGKLNARQQTYLGLSSSSLFDHAMAAHLQALKSNNNSEQALITPIEHVILTGQEYNIGQWVKIVAEKDQNKLVLKVGNEYKESVIDDKLLTLEMDQVFFGGVWPMVRPKKFSTSSIQFEPFAGCMKDIQIGTTPIDLLRRQSYGVDTGCSPQHSARSLFFSSSTSHQVAYPLPAG